MSNATTNPKITRGLARVFTLDDSAWTPRKALYRAFVEWLQAHHPLQVGAISDRQLYALLRARGFTESTRRGVTGFRGLRVPTELHDQPRLVPDHSRASYRRGDRSPEAVELRAQEVYERRRGAGWPHEPGEPYTDIFTECWHGDCTPSGRCYGVGCCPDCLAALGGQPVDDNPTDLAVARAWSDRPAVSPHLDTRDDGRLVMWPHKAIWSHWEQAGIDRARCYYCATPDTSGGLDRIVPQWAGGDDSFSNLVPICPACRAAKGDLTVESWELNQRIERESRASHA